MKMTADQILNWLDAQEIFYLVLGDGTDISVPKGIRAAVIQARDNQDEAAGMRAMEGLRG